LLLLVKLGVPTFFLKFEHELPVVKLLLGRATLLLEQVVFVVFVWVGFKVR
jgi:hypothetical protein